MQWEHMKARLEGWVTSSTGASETRFGVVLVVAVAGAGGGALGLNCALGARHTSAGVQDRKIDGDTEAQI